MPGGGAGAGLRTIRTITVDFWGTLLHDRPSSGLRHRDRRIDDFAGILASGGIAIPRPALEQGYDASGLALDRVWSAHRDVPAAEHVRMILAAADPALPGKVTPDLLAALVEAYAAPALAAPPAADPGALGALQTLRARGYALAIVSNAMRTPGFALRRLLEHHGLLGCFVHTTFSDEVGVRKPDPEIFALTLRAVGGQPETAVHVGDDSVLDVQGARAAGLRVVQVTGVPGGDGGPRPDAVIPALEALPDTIDRLERD